MLFLKFSESFSTIPCRYFFFKMATKNILRSQPSPYLRTSTAHPTPVFFFHQNFLLRFCAARDKRSGGGNNPLDWTRVKSSVPYVLRLRNCCHLCYPSSGNLVPSPYLMILQIALSQKMSTFDNVSRRTTFSRVGDGQQISNCPI